jgi:hypothetical protein
VLHCQLPLLSDSTRADGYRHYRSQRYRHNTSELCLLTRTSEMRKTQYSFEKRQREIAKQKKKEAKRLKKSEKDNQSDQEENATDIV